MPSKSIFRRPGAKHFQLVHRSQRDPLIHDSDANQQVLKPLDRENARRGKSRAELESLVSPEDLAHDAERLNIGEASIYGVYYDDTDYDYMRHLRQTGVQEDGVDSILVEAPSKSKGKSRAMERDSLSLRDDLPPEAFPSTSENPRDYDANQPIPASITGFQPDMDPHLRQVLEALEDDAFVDDELDDHFFGAIIADGEREDDEEVEFEFDEDGIEEGDEGHEDVEQEEGEGKRGALWEERFAQFKKGQKGAPPQSDLDGHSEGGDTLGTLPAPSVIGGKRRRKGASDASGYSMSSSSMFRNEGLTTLDERFDHIEKEYATEDDSDDDDGNNSDEAPQLITSREDFNSLMVDFLDNYEILGGKMRSVLPGGTSSGKLDTLRKAMGGDVRLQVAAGSDDEEEAIALSLDIHEKEDRWDCETILTTYTNLENHPRLICAREARPVRKVRMDPKTGLPSVDGRERKNPVVREDFARPIRPTVTRLRDESVEEKKARKASVKAERQVRRVEKKANKDQFAIEKKHQLKMVVGKETSGTLRKL